MPRRRYYFPSKAEYVGGWLEVAGILLMIGFGLLAAAAAVAGAIALFLGGLLVTGVVGTAPSAAIRVHARGPF